METRIAAVISGMSDEESAATKYMHAQFLSARDNADDDDDDDWDDDDGAANDDANGVLEEVVEEVDEQTMLMLLDSQQDPHVVCTRLLKSHPPAAHIELHSALMTRGYHLQNNFLTTAEAKALYEQTRDLFDQGKLQPANMERPDDPHRDRTSRGDSILFLNPNSEELKLSGVGAVFSKLMALGQVLGEVSCITTTRPEVQLALYPGNKTKYVRHRDALPSDSVCNDDDEWGSAQRKLTTIVYADCGWTSPEDGGQLRLFPSAKAGGGEVTVCPEPGRLVVFLSGSTDHEVLPCHRPRVAMTVWWK